MSHSEVHLFELPARFGGLGINEPVESALLVFSSSCENTSVYQWLLFVVNCPYGSPDPSGSPDPLGSPG